jgi:hypothetical protein
VERSFLTANYIVGEFPTTISGKYIKKGQTGAGPEQKGRKENIE